MLTAQAKAEIRALMNDEGVPMRNDRWYHYENFSGRPIIESDLDLTFSAANQAAQRIYTAANKVWKVSGTNMTSALSTFDPGGGIKLTTAGADNDQALLSPATVASAATYVSAIGGSSGTSTPTSPFLSTKAPLMHAIIELPSVAAVRLVAGFKLTTTPTLATDNDQAFIGFDTAHATIPAKFRVCGSVGGTDYDYEAKANSTQALTDVAADTRYVLTVGVLPTSRVPFFALNGQPVGPSIPALTDACGFFPVIGFQALTGSAKTIKIRSVLLSRTI